MHEKTRPSACRAARPGGRRRRRHLQAADLSDWKGDSANPPFGVSTRAWWPSFGQERCAPPQSSLRTHHRGAVGPGSWVRAVRDWPVGAAAHAQAGGPRRPSSTALDGRDAKPIVDGQCHSWKSRRDPVSARSWILIRERNCYTRRVVCGTLEDPLHRKPHDGNGRSQRLRGARRARDVQYDRNSSQWNIH